MSPFDPTRQEPSELRDTDPSAFSDMPPQRRRAMTPVHGSILPWVLLTILAVAIGFFVLLVGLPMREELHQGQQSLREARDGLVNLQKHVDDLEAARRAAEVVRGNLEHEVEVKEADLAQTQHAQEELAQKLEHEMLVGDVQIRNDREGLVVDLVDKILFDSGEAELNPRGKKLLLTVAESLAKIPGKIVDVRGHTDAVPISPSLRGRFPSNWELSTQRATHVVRYLQDVGGIAGERLMASGFSEYHPAANNASKLGRARNRRIEVVLLPQTVGQSP